MPHARVTGDSSPTSAGEHNRAVLSELGYDEDRILALERDGVVSTAPPEEH